jgi:hypothetical protein
MSSIHINPAHKGLLHQKLHVPKGQPIPASKLAAAEHSKSPAERREANFAANAKHWHHDGAPEGYAVFDGGEIVSNGPTQPRYGEMLPTPTR